MTQILGFVLVMAAMAVWAKGWTFARGADALYFDGEDDAPYSRLGMMAWRARMYYLAAFVLFGMGLACVN